MQSDVQNLHATCVSLNGRGVLLCGPSGAGKSDLALRLIDGGAVLVADDQVLMSAENGVLIACGVDIGRGLIEARGIGILRLPYAESVPVYCGFDLVAATAATDRLPEPRTCLFCGVSVPFFTLCADKVGAASLVRMLARGVAVEKL